MSTQRVLTEANIWKHCKGVFNSIPTGTQFNPEKFFEICGLSHTNDHFKEAASSFLSHTLKKGMTMKLIQSGRIIFEKKKNDMTINKIKKLGVYMIEMLNTNPLFEIGKGFRLSLLQSTLQATHHAEFNLTSMTAVLNKLEANEVVKFDQNRALYVRMAECPMHIISPSTAEREGRKFGKSEPKVPVTELQEVNTFVQDLVAKSEEWKVLVRNYHTESTQVKAENASLKTTNSSLRDKIADLIKKNSKLEKDLQLEKENNKLLQTRLGSTFISSLKNVTIQSASEFAKTMK